ncbi:alanine racemase [Roseibium suaedae]|uniref:Alanine racemase n=1 Tax=Roseibium suaedae TaxID=735517 RepID=A0A1M7NPV3_9HYPH|nr:alanine racemase [Roseibium suaedae]SHN05392.1 alanine racemase [Roseibium suaedae]
MSGTIAEMQNPLAEDIPGATGFLTIDLGALGRNYAKLAALAAPATTAAVVKADAYGLGAVQVAKTLASKGCRNFFVAQFGEALKLKPVLPSDARLFVLNGLQPGAEERCASDGIIPVINSVEQWDRWDETARILNRRLPAAVQFDTGMSRLGVAFDHRADMESLIKASQHVDVLFVMSHLACADEPENEQNDDQLSEMLKVAEAFPGVPHCLANSGGVFLGKPYHGALVRPGIALYGGSPVGTSANPMEPVVRLDIAVVQTRTVPAGTKVGYGGSQVTDKETRLATIAAGYADGLSRALSSRGAVYFNGVRLPIVGRVSMDSMTVDISALPEGTLTLGSRVEVLGPNQTLEDVARDAGTISYEILTSLGHRYQRRYV